MGIAAFLPLIGQGVSALSTMLTNRAQKKTNLDIYNTQRQDALADWNKQNQYNSPAAQMQRYKEAGLSPHLIYGQTNTAPAIRSTEAKAPNFMAPNIDVSGAANPLLIQAQLKNIEANTIKTLSETDFKNLNTKLLQDTFDYKVGQESWKTSLIQNKNLNLQADTFKKQTETDRMSKLLGGELSIQKQQIRNLIAKTDLTVTQKSQALQTISNMLTQQRLTDKKIATEGFIQEAYYARTGLTLSQKNYTEVQKNVAEEVLKLKQMGLTLDIIQDLFGLVTGKSGKSKLPR
jgi:hypothetical protein